MVVTVVVVSMVMVVGGGVVVVMDLVCRVGFLAVRGLGRVTHA